MRFSSRVLASLVLLIFSLQGRAAGQAAGSLDTTYGTGGVAFGNLLFSSFSVASAALSTTDASYLAKTSNDPGYFTAGILRRLADGTLPAQNGTDYFYTSVTQGSTDIQAAAVVVRPDNRVVIGCNNGSNFYLKQITTAGLADSTFGTAGVVTANSGGSTAVLGGLALQADGKLLVGGYGAALGYGSYTIVRVLRFTTAGVLDPTFGSNGQVSLPGLPSGGSQKVHLELLANGQIRVSSAALGAFGTALLNSDGSVDTSFANGGVASLSLPVRGITAWCTNDAGDTFIAAWGSDSHLALAHCTGPLVQDTSFGGAIGGLVHTQVGQVYDIPAGITQRAADGSIFVASTATAALSPSTSHLCLLRYRPDGTADADFGSNGVVTFPKLVETDSDQASGLAVQSDGKLLVYGTTRRSSGYQVELLARCQPGALETYVAPSFATPAPGLLAVPLGGTTTLSVNLAANTLQPAYQWRKNGAVIPGATAATYIISSMKAGDDAVYTVDVMNYAGTVTSSPTSVEVPGPPVISSLLAPDAFQGDATYTFNVSVTGHAPFTYHWQQNGVDVSVDGPSAATTSTLTVPQAQALSGTWQVLVTNDQSTATSTPVTITAVPPAPVVVGPPQSQDVVAGGAVSLSTTVTGRPPFTVQWQRGTTNVGGAVQQTSTSSTLQVTAPLTGTVSYRCVFTNADGSTTSGDAVLTTWRNPTVRQPVPRLLLGAGAALHLEPEVLSLQAVSSYAWLFNGRAVAGANTAVLDVPGLTLAQAGSYQLSIRSITGGAVSNSASVAVVESAPRTGIFAAGKVLTLAVEAAGDGLSYAWRRQDGQPVTQARYSGSATRTLTISPCAAGDAGGFYCDVTRAGATGTVTTGLLTAIVEGDKPVLQTAALDAGAVARPYSFQLQATSHTTVYSVTGLPAGLRCNAATGLISGTPAEPGAYHVRVIASNPVGASTAVTFTLPISALPRSAVGTWSGPVSEGVGDGVGSVSVTEAGSYSGHAAFSRLNGHVVSFGFVGQLADSGTGAGTTYDGTGRPFTLALPGVAARFTATLTLFWNATDGLGGALQGTNADGDTLQASFTLSRNGWNAVSHPAAAYAGYYTAELNNDPTSDAGGSGFAFFTVSTGGTFTFTGRLPDGMAFALPASLDAKGNAWVHLWTYNYTGRMSGTLNLTAGTAPHYYDTGVGGSVGWVRPASTYPAMDVVENTYFNGINTGLGVRGARYLKPGLTGVTGPYMMDARAGAPNLKATVSGGAIPTVTFDVNLSTRHTTNAPAYTPGDTLRASGITFNAATGFFSGGGTAYFYDVDGNYLGSGTAPFQGIVTRADPASTKGYGAGYFARVGTYYLFSPDDPNLLLQHFPVLWSGAVVLNPE